MEIQDWLESGPGVDPKGVSPCAIINLIVTDRTVIADEIGKRQNMGKANVRVGK